MPDDKPLDSKVTKGDLKPGKDGKGKDGKKGGVFQKYKWWIIGGAIVVVLLIAYFVFKSGNQANSTTAAQNANDNIDPATGFPYGSASDLAALGESGAGGTPGGGAISGAPGTTGATGPPGAPGKSSHPSQKGTVKGPSLAPDLWTIAKEILQGRGIKNPTNSQIFHVRKTLENTGATKHPVPKHNPHPVHPGKK